MDIEIFADGTLTWGGRTMRCALGRGGVTTAKREGDGATPAGRFALRQVLYRPDRLAPPAVYLPARPLDAADGWCDDAADPAYNRPVRRPFAARHETLWRADGLYDLLAVIGYNDAPPQPSLGSAIFLHVAAPGYAPTEGCVALALSDLSEILTAWRPDWWLVIDPA
jgi:L,D-peptidoglycan transpeptidase YkuD (ErfK/YbiS/YcfS/YnhG family)